MGLNDMIKNGKIVVVAGAGISKSPPSNLPSWWDFNKILIDTIGEVGSKYLNLTENALDADKIIENLTVVNVSQLFVNHLAGKTYFSLLSLLDGVSPNENHYMLAELAKSNTISAIVTTNFDTLIERAFEEKNIPHCVYSAPDDFEHSDLNSFPIYKIHGSADNPLYAIDTVMQKLSGLSVGKKTVMRDLFSNNHVLFMGFSGEDFLIDSDYIPISSCKKGITWIAHPGSKFNKQTISIIEAMNIDVQTKDLRTFYSECGWGIPIVEGFSKHTPSQFESRAKLEIEQLLYQPFINPLNCAGMCVQLLDYVGSPERADRIAELLQRKIEQKEFEYDIPALTQIGEHYKHRNDCEGAIKIYKLQLDRMENKRLAAIVDLPSYALNMSTILCNLSLIYCIQEQYDQALFTLTDAFSYAVIGRNWENIALSLYLISMTLLKKSIRYKEPDAESVKTQLKRYYMLKAAMNVAKHGGVADRIVEIGIALAAFYSDWGFKIEYTEVKGDIERALPLSLQDAGKIANMLSLFESNMLTTPLFEGNPIKMMLSFDYPDNWKQFGSKPILSYKEGREAKRLFFTRSSEECKKYMEENINTALSNKQLDLADVLLDALIGITLYQSNIESENNNTIECIKLLLKAESLLKLCFKIEIQLQRVDRVGQTIGMMTQLCQRLPDYEKNQALFWAELTLCLCLDPKSCWQMCHASALAATIHFENKSYKAAKEYCELFFKIIQENPNANGSERISAINEMYAQIIKS